MNRAAISISSNIAEGGSRSSEKDYKRFLEYSLGSCFELETLCIIIKELNLGNHITVNELLNLLEEEIMMIYGFMKKLKINH